MARGKPGRKPQTNPRNVMTQLAQEPSIHATPEFEAAVARAVDEKLASFLEQLKTQDGASSPENGDAKFLGLFRQMAMTFAEISDQGTDRKRVAPEILAARADAHKRMTDAITKHILNVRDVEQRDGPEAARLCMPLYRAIGKMYLNEVFIEPFTVDPATKRPKPREIRWDGVPNEVMRPLNKPAEEIYGHFMDSIGSVVEGPKKKPLWVTARGLVIEGNAPHRRQVGDGQSFDGFANKLDLDFNASDPTKEFINVLGTIHAPARQNQADRWSSEKRA